MVPLVNGPIVRTAPVELQAARFLRANAVAATKVTVPGPFTLSQLAQNVHYPDQQSLAMAYADAINAELHDLVAAGIDVVQIDEPYLQANVEAARVFAVEAINRAVAGVTGATTVLHTCYGYAVYVKNKSGGYPYLDQLADAQVDQIAVEAAQPNLDLALLAPLAGKTIVLGVLDLSSDVVESVVEVAARIRAALHHIAADRLVLAPDCGMKFLPRAAAFGKLSAMVQAAALVRAELCCGPAWPTVPKGSAEPARLLRRPKSCVTIVFCDLSPEVWRIDHCWPSLPDEDFRESPGRGVGTFWATSEAVVKPPK